MFTQILVNTLNAVTWRWSARFRSYFTVTDVCSTALVLTRKISKTNKTFFARTRVPDLEEFQKRIATPDLTTTVAVRKFAFLRLTRSGHRRRCALICVRNLRIPQEKECLFSSKFRILKSRIWIIFCFDTFPQLLSNQKVDTVSELRIATCDWPARSPDTFDEP